MQDRKLSPRTSYFSYVLVLSFLVTLTGCKAYQFGASTMYRFDIQTVHVAIFESNSYRRFLGQRLTEAVVK